MAESFISAIAEKVLSKITSLAFQEVSLAIGVKKDVKKLADTLMTIKAVLQDAEEKQAETHNPKLRVWLEKLKDVFYDAEDVLDEFEVEVIRRQVVSHGSSTKKVHDFFSCSNPLAFRFTMAHKIKKIMVRLAEIEAEKDRFGLAEKIDNRRVIIRDRETYSFVIASEVMGRDKDKEKIINALMRESEVENVAVVPIVGIGGVGKTALAKLVYNDHRVDERFDLKIWVCISDAFELKQLILKILKSATKEEYSNLDIEQLLSKMQEQLRGRKYLLVLDDVWKADRERWIEFKNLLLGGADGSKIIVTTRILRVASIMGTVSTFTLGALPYDECLSLFSKCAFRAGEEQRHPNLMKMGEEIVKKCGGIPLAVRTLGSLLYSSTDKSYWKHVRDNEIWKLEQKENDILPSLKLSYDQLPSHLKQCFVYCSIFPKDYDFKSIELVQFWSALGLLQSANGNEEPETVGMQYLKELVSRCFFQDFQDGDYFFQFKMHDLIHDLAAQMANGECVIVNTGTGRPLTSRKARHLSFVGCNTSEEFILDLLSKLDRVRTIILAVDEEGPKQQFVKSCISRFRFLRILRLYNSSIEVLPKEIGNLKHLRYLTLSGCSKIKKLPNSICKLQNLQTLKLLGCQELEGLPRDIRYLIGLQTFSLTTKQKCLGENEIGSLISLKSFLIAYCSNLEYLFEDINRLTALRILRILHCPKLISLPRGIKYLCSLEFLYIGGCDEIDLDFGMQSDDGHDHEISGGISPHLRVLRIRRLPKLVRLPQWLLQASANTLQQLKIVDCPNFIALPDPLQNLKSLQLLDIRGCPELTCLPEDMHLLTAMRKLAIEGCPALSERCKQGKGEDWPKIGHIPQIKLDGEMIKSPN